MNIKNLLTTEQMANFTAKGFVRFDGLIENDINEEFLNEFFRDKNIRETEVNKLLPEVKPRTKLASSYQSGSVISKLLKNPILEGSIKSLVGHNPIVDHHHIHIGAPKSSSAQYNHVDSAIDNRKKTFDIQILYFPHAVTEDMGGTRYIPGTQYRRVHTHHIARYQNIAGQKFIKCSSGTIFIFHHGIWHGGGRNFTNLPRVMFKLRLQPTMPQVLLWNTNDINEDRLKSWNRPIYHGDKTKYKDPVPDILMHAEPWFDSNATLEWFNRIKMWRFLLGRSDFDIDNWLSRIENDPGLLS